MRLAALGTLFLSTGIVARKRAVFLVATLAVAIAAWLLLAAVASPMVQGPAGADFGVMVMNGNQGAPALPFSYASRLINSPGATDVAWTTLQVVKCGAASSIVTINAYGGPGAVRAMTAGAQIDADTLHRWTSDPLGVVISSSTASDCGWHVGDSVSPATITGAPITFHVSGIAHVAHAMGNAAYAHFAYINRNGSMVGKDQVSNYTAYATDPRKNDLLAARIEEEFAHDFPTVNATTNTTVQGAWRRFGKIQELLTLVMVAVALCAASVLVTVFAHSAAQQRRTFALMRVFGFGRGMLFAVFALGALFVVVLGAALGIGAGIWIQHLFAHDTRLAFMTAGFNIPEWAYWSLPVWLAALLTVSLAWPALLVRRVRPIDLKAI